MNANPFSRVIKWFRATFEIPWRCCETCMISGRAVLPFRFRRRCPICGGTKFAWVSLVDVDSDEEDL